MTRISDERLEELISGWAEALAEYPCPPLEPGDIEWANNANSTILALRELRAYRKEGWRPIETAPKDGSRVICCGPQLAVAECEWCYWRGAKAGWYRSNQPPEVHPTYWMPLPAAPEPQEKT